MMQSLSSAESPVPDSDALLRHTATHLINQALGLLDTVIVSDQTLSRVSAFVPGSTIGGHLRHLHEHFRLLLDAAASSELVLDYDSRSRNTPMELNREACREEFVKLRRRIEVEAPRYSRDLALTLHSTTPSRQEFDANFGRELWFASLHATHHFALIRVIVTAELGLPLDRDFGVAPSTTVALAQAKI